MDQLSFETVPADQMLGLGTNDRTIQRARVAGGWIVLYDDAKRIKFCPWTAPPSDIATLPVPATSRVGHLTGVA